MRYTLISTIIHITFYTADIPIQIPHCLRNSRLPFDTNTSSSTFSCDDSDEKDDKTVDNGNKRSRSRSFGYGIFCHFYQGPVRQKFTSCVRRLGFGIIFKLTHRCYMNIHQMMRNRYYVLQNRCNAIQGLYDECSRRNYNVQPWRNSCRCSEYNSMRCIHRPTNSTRPKNKKFELSNSLPLRRHICIMFLTSKQ